MGSKASTQEDTFVPSDTKNVLLLGLRESGKSTIIKQLQFLTRDGLTIKQRQDYIFKIRFYVIQYMQKLLQQNVSLQVKSNTIQVTNILKLDKWTDLLNKEDCDDLLEIWNNNKLYTDIYKNSFGYFMNKLVEISTKNNYIPTDNDILMLYDTTHTMTQSMDIMTDKQYLSFMEFRGDVIRENVQHSLGGYKRTEVSTIIFLVDLSSFDVKDSPISKQTKMNQSLKIFEKVCFEECWGCIPVPIILFLIKWIFLDKKLKIDI